MPRHFSVCRSDYIYIMMHIIVLRLFINLSDLDFLESINQSYILLRIDDISCLVKYTTALSYVRIFVTQCVCCLLSQSARRR